MKNKKRVYLKIGLAVAAIVLLITAVAITLFSGGGGMFKGLLVTSQATFKSGDHVALSYNGKFCLVNKDNKIQCDDSVQHDFVIFRYGDVENYKPLTAGTKILLTYKADKNDRGSYCGKGLTVDFGICDKKLGKDSIYENYSYIYTFAGSALSLNGKSVKFVPYGSKVEVGVIAQGDGTTNGQTVGNSGANTTNTTTTTTTVAGSTSNNDNSGSTTVSAANDKVMQAAKVTLKAAQDAVNAAQAKVKAAEAKLNDVKIVTAEAINAVNNEKKEAAKVVEAVAAVNKAAGVINNNKSKISDVTAASKKASLAAEEATTAAKNAEKNVDYALDHNVVPVVVPANLDVVQDGDAIAIRSSRNLYCSSDDNSTHEITCSSKTVGDEQQFIIERQKGGNENLMGSSDYFAIKSKEYGTYCQPASRTDLNSKNNITCDKISPLYPWLFIKANQNSNPIKNTSVVYLVPEESYKCYIKKNSDATLQCDNQSAFSRAQFTVVKTFDKKTNQKTNFVSKQAPIIGSVFQDSNYKGWEYALVKEDSAMDSEISGSVSSMKLAKGYKARIYDIADPKVGQTKPAMTVLSDVPTFSLGDSISSLIITKGTSDKNDCTVVLYRDTKYSKDPLVLDGKNKQLYERLGDIDRNDSISSMSIGGGVGCYVNAWIDSLNYGHSDVTLTGNNYDLHMNDYVKYIKFDKSEFGEGSLK
jgi:hypothetical protein